MSGVYAQLQVVLKAAQDFEQTKSTYQNDPPDSLFMDNVQLAGGSLTGIATIANLVVDQALSVGTLTDLRLIFLVSDGPVDIKLVGAGTAIQIGETGKSGMFLLVGGPGPATILISNSSGGTREVRYYVAGQ
jgi:hypothetical protein